MCKSWRQSKTCPRLTQGRPCSFQHPNEHQAPPPQLCYEFRDYGRCNRTPCRFAHPTLLPAPRQLSRKRSSAQPRARKPRRMPQACRRKRRAPRRLLQPHPLRQLLRPTEAGPSQRRLQRPARRGRTRRHSRLLQPQRSRPHRTTAGPRSSTTPPTMRCKPTMREPPCTAARRAAGPSARSLRLCRACPASAHRPSSRSSRPDRPAPEGVLRPRERRSVRRVVIRRPMRLT